MWSKSSPKITNILFCLYKYVTHYSVCHGFKLKKQVDYFWVIFLLFPHLASFFEAIRAGAKLFHHYECWVKFIQQQSQACPNSWNTLWSQFMTHTVQDNTNLLLPSMPGLYWQTLDPDVSLACIGLPSRWYLKSAL